jgi:translation initiation factor IF-3
VKSPRINEKITAHRIILINAEGQNKGEILKMAALEQARRENLDLVEVAEAPVPVCKLMDYGKVLYEKAKQERHQKPAPDMKEIRFHYNTDPHDIEIKKRKIQEFLAKGHKVLIAMEVKGREKGALRSVAKEKFVSLVVAFSPETTLNDIKEYDKGYSFLLHPRSK